MWQAIQCPIVICTQLHFLCVKEKYFGLLQTCCGFLHRLDPLPDPKTSLHDSQSPLPRPPTYTLDPTPF